MTNAPTQKRSLASLWLKWQTPVGRNEVRQEQSETVGQAVWMTDEETSGRRLTLLTQSRQGPPAEDLEGFWGSKKTFKSGEEKAGSIDNIGVSRYLADGRLL